MHNIRIENAFEAGKAAGIAVGHLTVTQAAAMVPHIERNDPAYAGWQAGLRAGVAEARRRALHERGSRHHG